MFLDYAGVFLNFDKIFANLFKIQKEDELSQFILSLNKQVFEEGPSEMLLEEVLFAKTCFKLNSFLGLGGK